MKTHIRNFTLFMLRLTKPHLLLKLWTKKDHFSYPKYRQLERKRSSEKWAIRIVHI